MEIQFIHNIDGDIALNETASLCNGNDEEGEEFRDYNPEIIEPDIRALVSKTTAFILGR